MSRNQHTPGPWRWEVNEREKRLSLVGGRWPKFDLIIIQPVRWGMESASLLIRDTAFDGMNLLHKLHERRDWIEPFPGRDHHAHWCASVNHPDMRLMAAAPELLESLTELLEWANLVRETYGINDSCTDEKIKKVSKTISEATGE